MSASNPVYPNYFADPFVWRHNGVYYAIGTGVLDEHGEGRGGVFEILRSDDLFHWTPAASAMERLAPEYGDSYWAPEVAYAGEQFYLYYSSASAINRITSASLSPIGPRVPIEIQVCG
jgi:Beta-xylosidase